MFLFITFFKSKQLKTIKLVTSKSFKKLNIQLCKDKKQTVYQIKTAFKFV